MSYLLTREISEQIELMHLENQSIARWHFHNYLEIVYIYSGEAEHAIGNKAGVLRGGNFFIVDYDTSHHYFSKDSNLSLINCLFIPEFIGSAYADAKSFNELCERYFFRISGRKINGPTANTVFEDNGIIGELLLKMNEEYIKKQDGYKEMLRYLLCQVIIETIRKIGSNDVKSSITVDIIKIIDERYSSHITLQSICEDLHYSVPYVSSKFKSETGFTFTQYLQNRRIEESCRLLSDTNLPIGSIAEATGYTSLKFFNKVFKQVTKTTPREFRIQNKALF